MFPAAIADHVSHNSECSSIDAYRCEFHSGRFEEFFVETANKIRGTPGNADHETGPSSKKKRYWFVWEAAGVGGLSSEAESARASRDIS